MENLGPQDTPDIIDTQESPARLDNEFWERVMAHDFELPAGYSRASLTRELMSYLGLPDPERRETIAYTILDAWIHRDCYTPEELEEMAEALLRNLSVGLGEASRDSVLLRSFSLLILTEIVYHDLRRPSLPPGGVRRVLEETLIYFSAEQDLRGYDRETGWIHAVAHAADLFFVLAQHGELGDSDLSRILAAVASKVTAPTGHVYLYDEETRLVRAVMAVLQRDRVELDELADWLEMLTRPKGRVSWNEGFEGAESGPMMTLVDQPPPLAGAILPLVGEALARIRAWC